MADTVDIPKVGPVPKKTALIVVGAGAGLLVFMLYRQRRAAPAADTAAGAAPDTAAADPYQGLTDTGTGGTVSGYSQQGSDTATTGPTTNAQWAQAAAESLGGSYDPTAITDALGRYLNHQPLSDLDQRIVQAAIAFAGYPPVGTYSIIPGGNAEIRTAPTGLSAVSVTQTTATLHWNAVPGAHYYVLRRKDLGQESVGTSIDPNWQARGLEAGRSYQFEVAGVTAAGKYGPNSAWLTVTTQKPTGPVLHSETAIRN
jgi:fibronectin type III domain protein